MRYDLHVHTKYSGESNLDIARLLDSAKKKGLNGVAVTDHNTIKGALKALKANKDKDFEVIVGEEISIDGGCHLLGYYLNEALKSTDLFEAIDELKQQGALIVPAHPLDFVRHNFGKSILKGIAKNVDAIEAINGREPFFFLKSALRFAKKYKLAMTGGSDAHFAFEIGRITTEFEGDLRKAIKSRKTVPGGFVFEGYLGGSLTPLYRFAKKRFK
jgi:predicted metal-dependent phosphoesterase TrpH